MKPRTIASSPDTSMTPSRMRSRIVIGIGWSGPLHRSKVRFSSTEDRPSRWRKAGFPGNFRRSTIPCGRPFRRCIAASHANVTVRLAILAAGSRWGGIFFGMAGAARALIADIAVVAAAVMARAGRAGGGDVGHEGGQPADGIEAQAGIAAGLAARPFRQHHAREAE